MASATFVVSLGLRTSAPGWKKHGKAPFVVSLGVNATAAPYGSGSSVAVSNSTNKKVTLPTSRVPIAYVEINGQRLPCYIDERTWWAYLHDLDERRLGGPTAATVPDLETNVVATKEQAVAASATVANVSQQVDANAQSLAAVKEVAVSNSLSGASAIPPVQLTARTIEP